MTHSPNRNLQFHIRNHPAPRIWFDRGVWWFTTNDAEPPRNIGPLIRERRYLAAPLAAALGMSERSFRRMVVNSLGIPPGEWLREGVNDPFYRLTDGDNLFRRPPNWFVEMIAYSAYAPNRLKFDPVSGRTTPDGCRGHFDRENGPAVAAEAWKKHRIIAQMIPERSLPAGGAGGSGVAGQVDSLARNFEIENLTPIKTFDMQANANGWPQSRPALKTANGWRHSDLREVAYPYTYRAWTQPIIDANLSREP